MNRICAGLIRLLVFAAILNGLHPIAPLRAAEAAAAQTAAKRDTFREPATGLEFPLYLGGARRGKVHHFEPAGYGLSLPYNSQEIAITLYIYDLNHRQIPDGISRVVKEESAASKREVDAARQKGMYQAVKVVSEKETTLGDGTNAPKALLTEFELRSNNENRTSALYITGFRNQFVKVRCTYPEDLRTVGDAVLKQFVDDLGKLLSGEPVDSKPAVTKPLPSKEEVLQAIGEFKRTPQGRAARSAAATFMEFAKHSDAVTITLSEHLLPWLKQDDRNALKPILVAAFVAGNVEAQLKSGKAADESYAGLLQLIATYQELQKTDPGLKIPSIEKQIALEIAGKLRQHVRDANK